MSNYTGSSANVLSVKFPSSGPNYVAGDVIKKGDLVGIVLDGNSGANGNVVEKGSMASVMICGVFTMKWTGNAASVSLGAKIYGKDNSNTVNTTSGSRDLIGISLTDRSSGTGDIDVLIYPGLAT